MSSRQEEKAQRRAEREAVERAAAASEQRKRLAIVGAGAALALAAIVTAVLVLSGGSDDTPSASSAEAAIPARSTTNLEAALKAAKCTFKEFPVEGRTHSTKPFSDYKSNPPTSGTHNPVWAEDGIYDPGNPPQLEKSVHALEHGRTLIQYKPGTPQKTIDQLTTLFNEKVKGTEGYKSLLFENQSKMPYAVAITSWTRLAGCPKMNDRVFDVLRAFREKYVEQAPELVQ